MELRGPAIGDDFGVSLDICGGRRYLKGRARRLSVRAPSEL